MKILVISQYFYPDITAAANRIGETVDLLSKSGNEVSVITATPHKSSITNFEEFDISQDANIIRVSLGQKKSINSSAGLIKQYLSFTLKALVKVVTNIKKISPDVVWISSPPLPVILVSLVIKYIFRVPIVLDIRDIWPESAVNIGKLKKGSFLEKLGLFLEKISYSHADEITCVSSKMKTYIETKTSKSVSTIYNAVSSGELAEPIQNFGNPDIFCYAGNIGHAQDIELLVKSFASAKKRKSLSNSYLHILGDGTLIKNVKKIASELGINKFIKFFGSVPKSEAITLMSKAGCLLLPLKDAPAFRITVPSKVFDYMSLARPIITNISGEGASIISRNDANIVVSPSNSIELSNAMVKIREDWTHYLEKADKNREIIINEFTREQEVKKLETIFRKLVK